MIPATPRRVALLPILALSAVALAQGPGGPGGPGGGRGPRNTTTKVKDQFDRDGNGRLNREERVAAKAWLVENRPQRGRRGPGGFGGRRGPPGGGERVRDENAVGQKVQPTDVTSYAENALFDPEVVRTFFIDFPVGDQPGSESLDPDSLDQKWIEELTAFYRTDVKVPARVTVDGVTYADVGASFRGNTSFSRVRGKKKSFDLEFDFVDPGQNLAGVRNLDLLNCNGDASYMREALHGWVANHFLPAPRVALVRVVCNGEDFGIYAAVQQFDKDFIKDHYGTRKGDRFKVPPDFSGNGGLRFLGDEAAAYERNYQLKSGANPAAWAGLADLCAVLDGTETESLERILPQHLDIDAALWFLAVDNVLADDDGYHSRASDYALYRDPKGRFHPVARDNNEILRAPRGGQGSRGPGSRRPGGRGPGGRRGGDTSTPLAMADRDDRPLLKRMLEVPTWRARYLANVRKMATTVLAAKSIDERVAAWRKAIAPIVERDVHSQQDYRAFERAVAVTSTGTPVESSILAVIAGRRRAILDDPSMQGDWPVVADVTSTFAHGPDGKPALHVRCRAGGAKLATVRLHHDRGRFGAYDSSEMRDDGRSGDGEAGDGVYGGWLPAAQAKDKWRFWVEAVAADSGHVDCVPAGGGARPLRWAAPSKM